MLVNGQGQKVHSPEPMGRIAHYQLQDGLDWVTGDASTAYGDKLKKYLRHLIFVKPDVIVLVDDVEAAQPATFQWMLHAQAPFQIDGRQLRLDRAKAGVLIDYIADGTLAMRQWDGYDPPPGSGKAAALDRKFPNQWHVEAGTKTTATRAFTITVLRPYRAGPSRMDAVKSDGSRLTIPAAGGAVEV